MSNELRQRMRMDSYRPVKVQRRRILSTITEAADMLPPNESISIWPTSLLAHNKRWLEDETSIDDINNLLIRLGHISTCRLVHIPSENAENEPRPVLVLSY